MPSKTAIEWCDYSTNPLRAETEAGKRGHACAKISPGCVNCYSETINNRFGTGLDYSAANVRKVTHYLDEKELRHILAFKPKPPFKNGRRRPAVFPFDMTDVFGDWVDDETIDRCIAAFALRSDVDFLVLTKRPERMGEYITRLSRSIKPLEKAARDMGHTFNFQGFSLLPWPIRNLWLGVSCEDQKRADDRIPWLLKTPAAVRFLSCEPLLGEIKLQKSCTLACPNNRECERCQRTAHQIVQDSSEGGIWVECACSRLNGLHWVIVGGESGHGAREMDIGWVRSIANQCIQAKVPVFIKQLGREPYQMDFEGDPDVPGGTRHFPDPLNLKHKKGADMSEWPEDMRGIRQFPRDLCDTPTT